MLIKLLFTVLLSILIYNYGKKTKHTINWYDYNALITKKIKVKKELIGVNKLIFSIIEHIELLENEITNRINNSLNNVEKFVFKIILNVFHVTLNLCAKTIFYIIAIFRLYFSSELHNYEKKKKEHWDKILNILNNHNYTIDDDIEIYFIRHASSKWNDCLRHGLHIQTIYITIRTILNEILNLFSFKHNFIDAPLSTTGLHEAKELSGEIQYITNRNFNKKNEFNILTSNLRRSQETALIGLESFFDNSPAYILSSLQEETRNIDSYSMSIFGINNPKCALQTDSVVQEYNYKHMSTAYNYGNRDIRHCITNRFNDLLLQIQAIIDETKNKKFLIVGHSRYIKLFIDYYLTPESQYIGRQYHLTNCGIVHIKLTKIKTSAETLCYISNTNINCIRGNYKTT